jgi:hypothetical protein
MIGAWTAIRAVQEKPFIAPWVFAPLRYFIPVEIKND